MEYLMKVGLTRGKVHQVDFVGYVDVKDGVVVDIKPYYSEVNKHSSPDVFIDLIQESLTEPLLLTKSLAEQIEVKKKDYPDIKGVCIYICSYVQGGDPEVIRCHHLTAD